MTNTSTKDTGHSCGQETDHPAVSSAMTGLMAGCGCGPAMARMMAACTGAGATEDTTTEEGTRERCGESQGTDQESRTD